MIKDHLAEYFSGPWLDAWNSHNIDEIMRPFDDDVEFISPTVFFRQAYPDGKLIGKAELKKHYQQTLDLFKDLTVTPIDVLLGVDSVTVIYKRENRGDIASIMIFNGDEKIIQVREHYSPYIIADLPEEGG